MQFMHDLPALCISLRQTEGWYSRYREDARYIIITVLGPSVEVPFETLSCCALD